MQIALSPGDTNMNTLDLSSGDTLPPHAFDIGLQTCINLSCKQICPTDKLCQNKYRSNY